MFDYKNKAQNMKVLDKILKSNMNLYGLYIQI